MRRSRGGVGGGHGIKIGRIWFDEMPEEGKTEENRSI
jgi:hypothetical protein